MARCFIVEGPDNAGKDTVIRALFKTLSKPPHVIHCSGISGKSKEESLALSKEYYQNMFSIAKYAIKILDVTIILNRSHIGDGVYGPIYRGYTAEESEYVLGLETLSQSEVTGIFVTANPDTLLEREDGLSQSKSDIVKIARECRLFEEFTKRSRYDFTTINTTFVNEASLLPIVRSIINADI